MGLLTLQNIHKEFQNKVVLDEVSLMVERGECVSLVGANGSGKSTLLKIAMGIETADLGNHYFSSGIKVGYLSQNISEQDSGKNALHHEELFQLETEIDRVLQALAEIDPEVETETYQNLMRRYEKLYTAFETIDGYTLQSKIKKILLGLGLREGALELPLERLSGGEKMRVALARILLEDPDLLILDEPTNHLDIKAIEWLEDFIKKFSGGVLIVSHDRFFLDRVTTRIAELDHGHLSIKNCNYSAYIEQKKRIKAFYLKEQTNLRKQIRDGEAKVQKLRHYKKIKQSKSSEREVEKLKEQSKKLLIEMRRTENLKKQSGPKFELKPAGHLSKDIVMAEGLTKRYGSLTVFENLTFAIHGGERIGLIGPNGCGKTTLLNIMLGKDLNYTGDVNFGKWVHYAYLGQEIEFEDYDRTAFQEIEAQNPKMEPSEIKQLLARFNFYGDEVEKPIGILSGGECARLELAKIMLQNPHCLILDEPTNHLDLESREAIENAIIGFKGTVIAVSHDRFYLNQCVSRIISLENGRLVSVNGNYDAYCNVVSANSPQLEKREKSGVNKMPSNSKEDEAKETALKKKLSEIEGSIRETEAKIHELGTVTDEMDLEYYQAYGDLVMKLDELYNDYVETEGLMKAQKSDIIREVDILAL